MAAKFKWKKATDEQSEAVQRDCFIRVIRYLCRVELFGQSVLADASDWGKFRDACAVSLRIIARRKKLFLERRKLDWVDVDAPLVLANALRCAEFDGDRTDWHPHNAAGSLMVNFASYCIYKERESEFECARDEGPSNNVDFIS